MKNFNLFICLLYLILLIISCRQPQKIKESNGLAVIDRNIQKNAKINSIRDENDNVLKINLDTCKSDNANLNEIYISHKGLHKIGAVDTLHISDNLYSIKRGKYQIIEKDSSYYILSQVEIFYNGQSVFTIDSILTTGMYFYEKNRNIVVIPVIWNEGEFLRIETSLFILDLNKRTTKKITDVLTNCSFAFICSSGDQVLYNNSDKILSFDLLNNKAETLIDFDSPYTRIIKII